LDAFRILVSEFNFFFSIKAFRAASLRNDHRADAPLMGHLGNLLQDRGIQLEVELDGHAGRRSLRMMRCALALDSPQLGTKPLITSETPSTRKAMC
jgi:hypothetical protein